MERTYIMLKPDALQRGLIGEILARIEHKGSPHHCHENDAARRADPREHYAHIADKPFFPDTVAYMTNGPVLAMIVEG